MRVVWEMRDCITLSIDISINYVCKLTTLRQLTCTQFRCLLHHTYLKGRLSSSFQLGLGPAATEVVLFSLWNITSNTGLTLNTLQETQTHVLPGILYKKLKHMSYLEYSTRKLSFIISSLSYSNTKREIGNFEFDYFKVKAIQYPKIPFP